MQARRPRIGVVMAEMWQVGNIDGSKHKLKQVHLVGAGPI